MIVPIFIYRDRKSDKELHEEMERERRWRRMMEAEEEKRKRWVVERPGVIYPLGMAHMGIPEPAPERAEKEYHEAERKNPWDYQFLPEGWSILGQTYIPVINDYGYVYDGSEDDLTGGYCD